MAQSRLGGGGLAIACSPGRLTSASGSWFTRFRDSPSPSQVSRSECTRASLRLADSNLALGRKAKKGCLAEESRSWLQITTWGPFAFCLHRSGPPSPVKPQHWGWLWCVREAPCFLSVLWGVHSNPKTRKSRRGGLDTPKVTAHTCLSRASEEAQRSALTGLSKFMLTVKTS